MRSSPSDAAELLQGAGDAAPAPAPAAGGGDRQSKHINIIEVGEEGGEVTVTHMAAAAAGGGTPAQPVISEPDDEVGGAGVARCGGRWTVDWKG